MESLARSLAVTFGSCGTDPVLHTTLTIVLCGWSEPHCYWAGPYALLGPMGYLEATVDQS